MFDTPLYANTDILFFYTRQGKNLPNLWRILVCTAKNKPKLGKKMTNVYIKFLKNGFYLKIHYYSTLYFKHRYNKLTYTQTKKDYIPGV